MRSSRGIRERFAPKTIAGSGRAIIVPMLLGGLLLASPVASQDRGGPSGNGEVSYALPCSVYGGVEINGYCVRNPTPAQRSQAEAEANALKAKQAAIRREADARAAEDRRLAAEAAARRQAMIDERLKTIGPGRRLEAERFVDMKIAAEKARPPAKKRGICNLVYGSPQEVKLREAEEKRKAEGRPGIPVCPA